MSSLFLFNKASTCLRLGLFPAKAVDAWALRNNARRLNFASNSGDKQARSITSRAEAMLVRLFRILPVFVYFGLNGIIALQQMTT